MACITTSIEEDERERIVRVSYSSIPPRPPLSLPLCPLWLITTRPLFSPLVQDQKAPRGLLFAITVYLPPLPPLAHPPRPTSSTQTHFADIIPPPVPPPADAPHHPHLFPTFDISYRCIRYSLLQTHIDSSTARVLSTLRSCTQPWLDSPGHDLTPLFTSSLLGLAPPAIGLPTIASTVQPLQGYTHTHIAFTA